MAKKTTPQKPQIPPPASEENQELDLGKSGDRMVELALKYAKARKSKEAFDWHYMDFLCGLQCTLVEIATAFNCSEDTIERRVKDAHGITFAEYFRQKRALGFISLRRRQFLFAQRFYQMSMFLGKNYLGQSDHHTITGAEGKPLIPESKDVYDELAATLLKLGVTLPGKNGGNGSAKSPTSGKKTAVS